MAQTTHMIGNYNCKHVMFYVFLLNTGQYDRPTLALDDRCFLSRATFLC